MGLDDLEAGSDSDDSDGRLSCFRTSHRSDLTNRTRSWTFQNSNYGIR